MVVHRGDEPKQAQGRVPFRLHDGGEGVDIRGWTIRTVQKPIVSSTVEEELSQELGIKLPGMLFEKNSLQLCFDHEGPITEEVERNDPVYAFELSFDAVDALKMVGEADPNIKVKAAECWDSKTDRDDVEITMIERASDWTFSTRYPGTVSVLGKRYDDLTPTWIPGKDGEEGASSPMEIDYDALRNTDLPILYSSQVLLFEDELDDNGTASYKVRIRVMPSFLFILARFFLRIDGVLIRIYDTRYFHRFGSEVVIRETVAKEANLAIALQDVHASVLRDPDMAAQRIPTREARVENFRIHP